LEAARLAPSAANAQPWSFIVVEDEDTKRRLADTTAHPFLAEAGAVIVALGNPKTAGSGGGSPRREWLIYDMAIALEHMVLQATELGLATCWDVAYDEWAIKNLLDIPRGLKVAAILPVGEPGEHPLPTERKPLYQITHLDRYGNPLT